MFTEKYSWYGLFALMIIFVIARIVLAYFKKEPLSIRIEGINLDSEKGPQTDGKGARLIGPTPVLHAGATKVIGDN